MNNPDAQEGYVIVRFKGSGMPAPLLMPFGKYFGKTVEQIVLRDYEYFRWIHPKIQANRLRARFNYVDHVVNNFRSMRECALTGCSAPARFMSVYNGYEKSRTSSTAHIYCSLEHFNLAPTGANPEKLTFKPLTFTSALSPNKQDTKHLIGLLKTCMGLDGRRYTAHYLEEFFNNAECWIPYGHKAVHQDSPHETTIYRLESSAQR